MATDHCIYSGKSSPALQPEGRPGHEDHPDQFLGDAAEVTGGGAGNLGGNVEFTLNDHADPEEWLRRISAFRCWGAPGDTPHSGVWQRRGLAVAAPDGVEDGYR